jgi:23S rRNA (pseudouridine1915-N3)-methyltransferase|tara:strand:+ start:877 stop:1347 length:471 start_codon:yes stop_codon:yes gene_type:complete
MKIRILSIGTKMPSWVNEGVSEYVKRLPKDMSFDMLELPLASRSKNADIKRLVLKETESILSHIQPQDHVIALEVKGHNWSTEKLANNLESWQMNGQNVVFLIGGPDGLGDACRQRANQLWSLSALTLPHPIVRVVLAEQIYRAWTVTQNHPYHRA